MYSHKEKQSSTMHNRWNRYKRYNVQCTITKRSAVSYPCTGGEYTSHIFTKHRIYLIQLNSFFVEVFKDDQRGR